MMKNYLYLLLTFFYACQSNISKDDDDYTTQINIELNDLKANTSTFNNLFTLKESIILETNQNTLIGTIGAVLFSERRIFVSDENQRIFFFDREGNTIKTIVSGKGPGQYLDVVDIQYDHVNSELYAWSLSTEQMFIYDDNGNFKRKLKLPIPIYKFYLIDSTQFLCYTNFATNLTSQETDESYNQLFFLKRKKGNWEIKYKDLSFSSRNAQQLISWSGTTNFSISNQGLFFMPPFKNYIYKFDSIQGAFQKEIRFDFGKNKIPDDFLDKEGTSNLFQRLSDKGYIHGWENFYMDDDLFCFTTGFMDERTIIYNFSDNSVQRFSQLIDLENEIPLHLIPNITKKDIMLTYTTPQELHTLEKTEPNSLGIKLVEQTDEFDNPILLLYERK